MKQEKDIEIKNEAIRTKKNVKGSGTWKTDYHLHTKDTHRKIENWWECICECLSRTTMKAKIRKEIEDND